MPGLFHLVGHLQVSCMLYECPSFLRLNDILKNFYLFILFGCTRSQLWHMGSLVAACGTYFPDQGCNSGPLHWEQDVSATGPLGKFQAKWYSLVWLYHIFVYPLMVFGLFPQECILIYKYILTWKNIINTIDSLSHPNLVFIQKLCPLSFYILNLFYQVLLPETISVFPMPN